MIEIKNELNFYDEKQNISVFFQTTSDDSLSLKLKKCEKESELMHSTGGAFSETIYVYSPVVEFIINHKLDPIFISIGLGVGYIEIMIVAFLMAKSPHLLKSNLFCIQSFESENIFIKFFKGYFLEENVPDSFRICYDKMLDLNSKHFLVAKEALKSEIRKIILNSKIIFHKEFLEDSKMKYPAHGIFFDAFSAQSSPDLWEDRVLKNVFHGQNCSPIASFATYASRTILKRILKENCFILKKKKGFLGKRECILAERFSEK